MWRDNSCGGEDGTCAKERQWKRERRAGHEARLVSVENTLVRVGKKVDDVAEDVSFLKGMLKKEK